VQRVQREHAGHGFRLWEGGKTEVKNMQKKKRDTPTDSGQLEKKGTRQFRAYVSGKRGENVDCDVPQGAGKFTIRLRED